MTDYKLTYFDFHGGRGESIRIAFHMGGISFEDERLAFPEFMQRRAGYRFNALPVMEIDGVVLTQSNAMNRYVGRLTKLYPEDLMQALYCDETMDAVEDLTTAITATMGLQAEALEQARKKLVDAKLTNWLGGMEALLERGGGSYFADGRLTVADLKSYVQVKGIKRGALDHVPADIVDRLAPKLSEHTERVGNDERVAAYYASLKG